MIDYTGLNCPVCGKPFTRNDDIVVCPECGAPYHRECYTKEGKCIFSDKHGTSAAWTPPKQETQKEPENRAECKTKRCPRCGNMNSQSAMFCDRCGLSLTANQQDARGFQQNQEMPQNGFPPPYGAPFPQGQPIPFLFDPMGGINPNDQIDDVSAGDISKLVQSNTPYYLPVFMNLKRFGRNRFNFSAFLFSGGWMLYRKQYKIGSIITAVMTVLYLISTYVSINFATPLLQSMFQKQGLSLDSSVTYAQMMQVIAQISQQPNQQVFLFCLPTVIAAIQIIIMLVVGFNGNKWYLKHCVSKVKQIHQQAPDATRAAIQYQEQGGVNAALAICLLICYMIVMYLPQLL